MVINRRIIVVQLKPNTTEAQLDELILKYKLKVVDHAPSLGALYVELDENSREGSPDVRSLLEPAMVVKLFGRSRSSMPRLCRRQEGQRCCRRRRK